MLLLGKQYTKKNKNKIGGVIKLFELFKTELRDNDIQYEVVDLNWRNYRNPLFAYIHIYYCILFKLKKHNLISLHGTANEYLYIAPVLVFFGRCFNKKITLRKFAGNFDQVYLNSNFLKKKLIRYSIKNSDLVLWETKHLVNFFKRFNSNTYWFPNVRPAQMKLREGEYKNRYVFIGQIKETKGVLQILEAFNQLNAHYSVDFYGPLEGINIREFCNENVNYCGVLNPEQVPETLIKYDVLLLPTFHPGEGYPGVIIEAFSCGLPVISSNWGGVPEIVRDGVDGLLVNPKNVSQLHKAIISINVDNHKVLSSNALKSFDSFKSDKVTRDILNLI